MAANTRKFNTISISSGAIYRKFRNILEPVEVSISDISNDFRMGKIDAAIDINNDFRSRLETLYDLNNDFRFFVEVVSDINNDFRMVGTIVYSHINNDFRFADWADDNINNDFRMVGARETNDINNDFRNQKEELYDIANKFDMIEEVLPVPYINNKFNSCIEIESNIQNIFASVKEVTKDIDNDFRTKAESRNNVNNDFRMVSSWQVPEAGEVGFQSAGKTEVKLYINTVEQTDVDIDSIGINQVLNGSHNASFNLGRPYDDTKPNDRDVVEIKYKGILLYKGYVTEINPTDSPESIRVNCQDEYWNMNKTKKYFFVGRKPADTNEFYYETIEEALSGLGFTSNIGNFIPQTMNLYGNGHADAISQLIQNSGNFSWFINPDGTKCLWQAGEGNIVELEKQTLGTNLGLYQAIKHNIRESVIGLINKLRVQMGNWTIKSNSDDISAGSGSKTYITTYFTRHEVYAYPAWDEELEKSQVNSGTGYGYDNQDPNKDYKDVFRKYYLPSLDPKMESWTDRYPPLVEVKWGIISSWTNLSAYISEGFSIDYGFQVGYEYPLGASDIAKPSVTFSEPQVVFDLNSSGECYRVRNKIVKLYLWKEHKVSYTVNPQTDPDDEPDETDLMFYTDKMGTYPQTITGDLNLSGLSKQEGFVIRDEEGNIIESIPSWDDTEFAKEYARFELSKMCDKKIVGSIDISLDAFLYYNIDLSKRIKIEGITSPINIKSISINFNSWIATLNIEKNRYFRRTINIPYRGE